MPKPVKKPKRSVDFDKLHDSLHNGKKIQYSYDPAHEGEQIRMFLHDDSGFWLIISPDGTYKLE